MRTTQKTENHHARGSIAERAGGYLRTRTALGRSLVRIAAELRSRRVPVRWSNLFGVVAFASVAVLFVSGVILMFFYTPSSEPVTYNGSYTPLTGAEVSKAFDSTMTISFEVRGGLLLRQLHHWAALLLPAAIIMQLLVMFFTGGFRRPRQASWVMLFLLLIVALAGGWSGYALPDDMLSGSGLRIVEGIVLGIPVIGSWMSALLFGGEFPGSIVEHLYPIHVLIVPVALVVLLIGRAWSSYTHKPPQFAAPGHTEDNVVGVPMLPNATARAGGLFALVVGVLMLISATVTISPIWLYGPADPGNASAGSQPDWYTGFLDGALRLVPPGWEFELFGYTWTLAVLVPLAVVGVFLTLVALYPYIEGWITHDREDHHILDRPRNAATRTGIGVAGMVFYGVLWGAASADIAATRFGLGLESVIIGFQIALLVGPLIAFELTRRACLALQKKDREIALHGYETGRIVRLPGGEYIEVHEPLDKYDRWKLVAHEHPKPFIARPDDRGRIRATHLVRARLAKWFLEDHIPPADDPAVEAAARTRETLHSGVEFTEVSSRR
ncbi:cytochrome b N-terminal domain-containing protein [Diaminobutyricimonas sp. TR449]|uniref:cytochrome bc1 complex cytochrome b subunit n=1 Tax=Diaminobutyricimonas sp. TR449 TaxID=2708076 RepID=UPI001421CE44|nr:cytochrome b N-terminal domain-containing protein [Diaminobutyricimonas sp. TR449]